MSVHEHEPAVRHKHQCLYVLFDKFPSKLVECFLFSVHLIKHLYSSHSSRNMLFIYSLSFKIGAVHTFAHGWRSISNFIK